MKSSTVAMSFAVVFLTTFLLGSEHRVLLDYTLLCWATALICRTLEGSGHA